MANTEPSIKRMSLSEAFSFLEAEHRGYQPFVHLTSFERRWRPLQLQGFEELPLLHRFELRRQPREHLALVVIVKAQERVEYSMDLKLCYAMDPEACEGLTSPPVTLVALATAHVKADLVVALEGMLPQSHERTVFLSNRGWTLDGH